MYSLFIALQRKTRKKGGKMFPPHDTPGVAVVRVAVVSDRNDTNDCTKPCVAN